MARLRARGNLSCFYCGKRTSIKFDPTIRDFLCLHCDATNYLDENGDITDPPVARTASSVEPTQYATARSHSPPQVGSLSESIFCPKCLKNQHLFTSSLAQYLPEDPSHPDYERLEKNYYKYRQHLEKLYPQICEECEPRVMAQVDRAGYTARTDHLRRMMDKTRQRRATPKQWSALDTADWLGKSLWQGGLALQLLWHLVVISDSISVTTPGPIRDPDEVPTLLASILGPISRFLPRGEVLIHWSVIASMLSVWWNPRFVQVFRGFSRHVIGLSQWYIFQALVVTVRFAGRRATKYAADTQVSRSAQMSLHGLLALAMTVFYVQARKIVRVDSTPLFQTNASPIPSPRAKPTERPARREEPQSLATMLDEILKEPTPKPVMEIPTRPSRSPSAQLSPSNSFYGTTPTVPNQGMSSLGLTTAPPPVKYSEEMDWSPTQSKHRAFNDFGSPGRDKQGFNESPTNVGTSTFWYKVPPAPKPPLHRLADTSHAVLREKPAKKEAVFFPGTKTMQTDQGPAARSIAAPDSKVSFAQPSFFADTAIKSTASNDPRNSLADMLNSSFTIRQDDSEEDNASAGARERPIELRFNLVGRTEAGNIVDVLLLIALLSTWVYSTSYGDLPPFTRDMMLVVIGLTMFVGLHMARAAILDLNAGKGPYGLIVGNAALSLSEVVGCSMLLLQVWSATDAYSLKELATPGTCMLSVMLAHEMVSCFALRMT